METTKLMAERARIKVVKLRTLAAREISLNHEPLRLFKEIEKDPKCNWILKDSKRVEKQPEIVEYYNEHIRQSKLSKEDKESLFI